MYHAIVRHLIRDGFARMARTRDATHIVNMFASDGRLRFAGSSAFGGERRGPAEIAAWFALVFDYFPDLGLEPIAIVVDGWPWATRVATRFAVTATLPDGTPYRNEGMQFVRLSFGRIVEDVIFEDTARLESALGAIERGRLLPA